MTEHSQKSKAFIGDFNIDILDDNAGADFSNLMYSRNFFPFINIPTQVTEQSFKCLYHIWYNRHNSLFSAAFITDITDHYSIFTVLNVAKKKIAFIKTIRNLSEENLNAILHKMHAFVEEFDQSLCNKEVNEQTE